MNITSKKTNKISYDVPMGEYTSFKTGGRAKILAMPETVEELKAYIGEFKKSKIQFMVMGKGSNILVRDGGYNGAIIKLGNGFDNVVVDGNCLIAGAGASLAMMAKVAQKAGLTGLEFASGIPGSFGGAVFMNAGAYDGEIKDVLDQVDLLARDDLKQFSLKCQELELSYRYSKLQETMDIFLGGKIALKVGDPIEIQEKMTELLNRRNTKQPVNYPSAGSFFKRPQGHFAGKLIDDAGLRGLSVGGAKVSELHCGFIINTGNATTRDITQLMDLIIDRVKESQGVLLTPEVRIIGDDLCTK